MKKVQYQVVNANGNLIKFFGSDHASAKIFMKENESCGLMYGLRIVKYFVNA